MSSAAHAFTVDAGGLEAAIRSVSARVAGMLDGADTAVAVPGTQWTVGEAGAHLAFAQQAFGQIAAGAAVRHGDGTRSGLAAANAEALARWTDRDGASLAATIREGTAAFLGGWSSAEPELQVHTPLGTMAMDTCASYVLMHLMQHGWQIARALGRPRPWGRKDVAFCLPIFVAAMPGVTDRSRAAATTACFEIHLRGGPRLALMFDDGELTVAPSPARRVDCHISADPVAFFLLGTGLAGQVGQILRGRLIAWGRRPWLAFRLPGTFAPP